MAILTEKTKKKLERDGIIKSQFSEMIKQKGSQKQAIYEAIQAKLVDFGFMCSVSTVQKVVNERRK